MIACLLTLALPADAAVTKANAQVPDVLVLALCGTGPTDQVSINYSLVVPGEQVTKDIKAIGKETGWFVGGEKVTTQTVSAGGGPRTTSGSFTTLSIVDYKEGLLPLEPFVNALKRYRSIEVNFLTPKQFRYRGPEEFENDYVKIDLIQGGGSYLYRVRVKNSDFERILLPKGRSAKQAAARPGPSSAARAARAVVIAAACAAAAYVIGYGFYKRRRTADGK